MKSGLTEAQRRKMDRLNAVCKKTYNAWMDNRDPAKSKKLNKAWITASIKADEYSNKLKW